MRVISLVVGLFLFAGAAQAQSHAGQFSVGSTLGIALDAPWATREFTRVVGPGLPRLGFQGRWHFDGEEGGMEIAANYFRVKPVQKLSFKTLSFGFFWRWMPNQKLHPVFGLGVGMAEAQNYFTQGQANLTMITARAGVEYELKPDVDVAFHLDQFFINKGRAADPNALILMPSVSLILYLGDTTPAAAPSPAKADAPTTPSAAPTVAKVDGDQDNDGVKDSMDRCAGTPSGISVNALGCAAKQSFEVSLDVKFPAKSAKFPSASEEALNNLASLMKEHQELMVEIQGHTDSSGSPNTNTALSQARADAVRQQLIKKHGLPAGRLTAKGYGPSQPVDTNNNPGGRANNRRVTAVLVR